MHSNMILHAANTSTLDQIPEALWIIRIATSFEMRVSCKYRYGRIVSPKESYICSVCSSRGKRRLRIRICFNSRLTACTHLRKSYILWWGGFSTCEWYQLSRFMWLYLSILIVSLNMNKTLLHVWSVRNRCSTRIEPHRSAPADQCLRKLQALPHLQIK